MVNYITVTYDDNEPDLPAIVSMIHKRASRVPVEMKVGYIGEGAQELYKILTEQGYLIELLRKVKKEDE